MIENFDNRILKDGFAMPKFKDGIMVILLGDKIIFYRILILLFYLLGVYNLRFFQITEYLRYIRPIKLRFVEFIPREWHPLSFVEEIIFGIILLFSESKSVSLKVHKMIVVDVDEKDKAYIKEIII